MHPCCIAFDKFKDGRTTAKMFEGRADGQYLENRLRLAFQAGWDAHKEFSGEVVAKAVVRLLDEHEKPR